MVRDRGDIVSVKPKNGKAYALGEAFTILDEQKITPYQFWGYCTNPKTNPLFPKLICSRATFFRKYKLYKSTGKLPSTEDFGIQIGAPQTLQNGQLAELNRELSNTN